MVPHRDKKSATEALQTFVNAHPASNINLPGVPNTYVQKGVANMITAGLTDVQNDMSYEDFIKKYANPNITELSVVNQAPTMLLDPSIYFVMKGIEPAVS